MRGARWYDVEYRQVSDLDAVADLAKAAFVIRRPNQAAAVQWLERSIEHGRQLYGIYDGTTLLSVYMLYDFRMHLRGAVVPMGGIGLLCSRLDARGKGAVRTMISAALGTMRDAGHAVSVLDPFRRVFYEKYGWGLFDRRQEMEIAPGGLSVPDDAGPAHNVVDLPFPDDAARAFYNELAATRLSLVQRGEAEWEARTWVLPWHTNIATRGVVKIARDGKVVGLIGYDLSGRADAWHPTLSVNLLLVRDEPAKREALRYLNRLSHQVKTLRFDLPPDDDLWVYLTDGPDKWELREKFMLRVVSVDALDGLAVDADDLSISIDVVDEQAPWNAGIWRWTVDRGILRVEERADRADVRCGIGALSSILSGFTDFKAMIAAGRCEPLPTYAGQDLPRATTFLADYF